MGVHILEQRSSGSSTGTTVDQGNKLHKVLRYACVSWSRCNAPCKVKKLANYGALHAPRQSTDHRSIRLPHLATSGGVIDGESYKWVARQKTGLAAVFPDHSSPSKSNTLRLLDGGAEASAVLEPPAGRLVSASLPTGAPFA